ncbi:MAG: UMP kinase [Caldisericia bacterium]
MDYKRILIKISGESLSKENSSEYDLDFIMDLCRQIKNIQKMGVQISIVIGGGNFWRGVEGEKIGVDRSTSDYIGMIATIMNALFIQSVLERMGLETRVQSALTLTEVCEPYIRRRAIRHLEKGRIVIFAAGTGNPYFTTDTAAALRASEINAEVILKGTNVEGVYSEDPKLNKDAKLLKSITYTDFLIKNLKALDPTAISLSRETNIPLIVFNIKSKDSIIKALNHEEGTIIKGG